MVQDEWASVAVIVLLLGTAVPVWAHARRNVPG
jgi:hypothetical protein